MGQATFTTNIYATSMYQCTVSTVSRMLFSVIFLFAAEVDEIELVRWLYETSQTRLSRSPHLTHAFLCPRVFIQNRVSIYAAVST